MKEYIKIITRSSFSYLWISQILSQVTVNMMNFLLLTRLFTITGSSIATALLWVTYALPSIFFGPIGAASVDIINKRKILMLTNLLQAASVVLLIFFQTQSIFLLYFVVLAYSFFNQFYVPAESASLVLVVDKKHLAGANSIFFITQQSALIVGFGLGGIMERLIGFNGSLILCAAFLFVAFVSVSFLTDMKDKTKTSEGFEKLITKFFTSIVEGYRFIKSKKAVLYPLLLLLVLQVPLAIIIANLPIIGTQILKVGLSYSGLLVVVPAGIGAFIGSVIVPRELKNGVRKKALIEIGLIFVGIAFFGLSLGVSFIPLIYRLIASIVLIIFAGIGYVLANIPALTFLQETTPAEIRGRVFGNFWFMVTIITIFPVIFSGFITEFLGVKLILFLMGAGCLAIFTYMYKSGNELIENNF